MGIIDFFSRWMMWTLFNAVAQIGEVLFYLLGLVPKTVIFFVEYLFDLSINN